MTLLILSPSRSDESVTLRLDKLGEMIDALGTPAYGATCLHTLESMLDVEHWALFRYRTFDSVECIAEASRTRNPVVRSNIDRFVEELHHVDPVMIALRKRRPDAACVMNMQIEDIWDVRYRRCFEVAHVRERLSFVSRYERETYQVSVFRGTRRHRFSMSEMKRFAPIAGFIVSTALKHEMLLSAASARQKPLNLDGIEWVLVSLAGALSKREREVCSRAAVGMTIEQTAIDLGIGITSVITYRQRAYSKLGISRQIELVALVTNAFPTGSRSQTEKMLGNLTENERA